MDNILTIILTLIIGFAIGAVAATVRKYEIATGWTNKELDGTMFIAGMILAFFASIIFTFIKPEFAELATTEKFLEILENLFMIIVGYLFKKATDSVQGNGGNRTQQKEP